jgi:DNA-binding transcriptional ArsR family regulator
MELIDRIRKDIQDRLEAILGEADKLRKALVELDPRRSSSSASRGPRPMAPTTRPVPRTRPTRTSRTRTGQSSRRSGRRTPPGATKRRVIDALSDGSPRTAGEVAAATGLARGTVSTTLSKLARSGEIVKAERGYRLHSGARASDGSSPGGGSPSAGGSSPGGGSPSAGGSSSG